MMTAGQIRFSVRQAHRWRDMLWEALLDDLEKRNPEAGFAARAAIQMNPVRHLVGSSTYASVQVWPYLDAQARADWIWICRFVQHTWIRGSASAFTIEMDED